MRNVFCFFCTALLFVTATYAQDSAGQPAPSIIQFDIKVYETEGVANRAIGFDWYTSQGLRGAAPDSSVPANTGNPAVGTLSGVLSDPQFRGLVRALDANEKNTRLIARSNIATISGKPLQLQRPDGWNFQFLPTVDPQTRRMTSLVQVRQTKGDYAGFLLNTHVILNHRQAAIFSDSAPKSRKVGKRLLITIVPTIETATPE